MQNLLLVGLNKITYVKVPKAVFGMLEDSLNASSLALSPWLCIFEKRQKKQAQWNAFFEASLKQSSTLKSVSMQNVTFRNTQSSFA